MTTNCHSESSFAYDGCPHKTEEETLLWILRYTEIDGTRTCTVRCCRCQAMFEILAGAVKAAYFFDACLLCLACDDFFGLAEPDIRESEGLSG